MILFHFLCYQFGFFIFFNFPLSIFNYLKYFVTAAALKEAISLIMFTAETSKG